MDSISSSTNLKLKLDELSIALQHPEQNFTEVTHIATETLEIVTKDPNLWKSFKNWAKRRNIKSGDLNRCDVKKIVGMLQEKNIFNLHFAALAQDLITAEKLHSGRLSTYYLHCERPSHEAFVDFETSFMEKVFNKNEKKLLKILAIIIQYQAIIGQNGPEAELLGPIILNLKVFALQHLVKTSKAPILEQKGPFHHSFLEYHINNQANYFRHDSGVIAQLLLDFFKEKYGLKNEVSYAFEVIKPGCFSSICSAACKILEMTYKTNNISLDDDNTFFDISLPLQETFLKGSGETLELLMKDIIGKIPQNKNLIFGGVIKVEEQEYMIVFPLPQGTELMWKIIELRGGTGVVPEISQIRHQLVKLEYPLNKLFETSPITQETSLHSLPSIEGSLTAVSSAIDHVLKTFPQQHNNQAATIYNQMFKNALLK
ncbi:MAG: hypothetical protein H0V82_03470 [Candidatus Protochlamydia sp.]|nr:hypothetical protein [Candidatus Protochlamydia sp.]